MATMTLSTGRLFAGGEGHGHDHDTGFLGHLNLHFLMNDLFMALFFGLAAKENY